MDSARLLGANRRGSVRLLGLSSENFSPPSKTLVSFFRSSGFLQRLAKGDTLALEKDGSNSKMNVRD